MTSLEQNQLRALYFALNDWIEETNFTSLLKFFHVLAQRKANEFYPLAVSIRGIARSHLVFRKARL